MARRRGGPTPYLRLDFLTKLKEGRTAAELIWRERLSVRQAAAQLGMSPTTCWRRAWWFMDLTLPHHYGRPRGPLPPQRGTRACPRGRPWLPTLDGRDDVARQARALQECAGVAAARRALELMAVRPDIRRTPGMSTAVRDVLRDLPPDPASGGKDHRP